MCMYNSHSPTAKVSTPVSPWILSQSMTYSTEKAELKVLIKMGIAIIDLLHPLVASHSQRFN